MDAIHNLQLDLKGQLVASQKPKTSVLVHCSRLAPVNRGYKSEAGVWSFCMVHGRHCHTIMQARQWWGPHWEGMGTPRYPGYPKSIKNMKHQSCGIFLLFCGRKERTDYATSPALSITMAPWLHGVWRPRESMVAQTTRKARYKGFEHGQWQWQLKKP